MCDNLNAATQSFDPDIVLKSVHPKYRDKLKNLWENIKPNIDLEKFVPPPQGQEQTDQDYADMIENYMRTYSENASVRPGASQSVWAGDQSSASNVQQPGSREQEGESRKPRSTWTDDYFKANPPQGETEAASRDEYGLDVANVDGWSETEINRVYQKMVDEGKIKPDYLAVTTQKRQKILGVLGGAR